MTGTEKDKLLQACEDRGLHQELIRLYYLVEKALDGQTEAVMGAVGWKRVETPNGPAFSAEQFCVYKTPRGAALWWKASEVLALDLKGRVIVPGAQVFEISRYKPGEWEEPFRTLRRRSGL